IEALRALGLWPQHGSRRFRITDTHPKEISPEERKSSERALAIWKESLPAEGSAVEKYLASRWLRMPIPESLRFHPHLWHCDGGCFPAMVALVTDLFGNPVAIHRTYLNHDGSGKAPVRKPKMMLGPCKGNAVRLAPNTGKLMVGEGIETCLSAMA